ncbi:MAG: choice-of-anchor Q domain-containing protein [Thermoleophilia bacterium]
MTRALTATSPALGIVPLAVCEGFDQRGVARPQGVSCDAGAFELGVPTNVSRRPSVARRLSARR